MFPEKRQLLPKGSVDARRQQLFARTPGACNNTSSDMRRSLPLSTIARPPLVRIQDATFYRHHPSAPAASQDTTTNPPLFPNLTFSLSSSASPTEIWSVFGNSAVTRTAFLHLLRGQYICIPPAARSYPYLASDEFAANRSSHRTPANAIHYVGFDAERGGLGGTGTRGAYLSARYESRREATDFSLLDYLLGRTELNPAEDMSRYPAQHLVDSVVNDLELKNLMEMPVSNLSNGQTRRARIAKALLTQPELLLLDGPFMGLDPQTASRLSPLLRRLAEANAPRMMLSLAPKEPIPDWITHLVYVDDHHNVLSQGPKEQVIRYLYGQYELARSHHKRSKRKKAEAQDSSWISIHEIGRFLDGNDTFRKMLSVPRSTRGAHRRFDGEDPPSSNSRLEPEDLERNPAWPAKLNALGLTWFASPGAKSPESKLEKRLEKATPEQRELYARVKAEFLEGSRRAHDTPEVTGEAVSEGNVVTPLGEPLVEMSGVQVKYGDKIVLGNWWQPDQRSPGLWWTLRRGHRYGLFGPNGSGKTTLLSLITSDHPQSYSAPLKLFGRSRLPQPGQPGISLFDIQSRIGHSSPEVHAFFPKHLSVRRTIESAWADAPLAQPSMTYANDLKVNAVLRWFQAELNPALGLTPPQEHEMMLPSGHPERAQIRALTGLYKRLFDEDMDPQNLAWAESMRFGELSFSAQRVALFLRAIINAPDLVVLDEAFSGMDEGTKLKCMTFLRYGERRVLRYSTQLRMLTREGPKHKESSLSKCQQVRVEGLKKHQALLVVSHKMDDVPDVIRDWVCLPEPGTGPPRFGTMKRVMETRQWEKIWGISTPRRKDGPEVLEKEKRKTNRRWGRPKGSRSGPRVPWPKYSAGLLRRDAMGRDTHAKLKAIHEGLSDEQAELLQRYLSKEVRTRLRRLRNLPPNQGRELGPDAGAMLEFAVGEETYLRIQAICADMSDKRAYYAREWMTDQMKKRRQKAVKAGAARRGVGRPRASATRFPFSSTLRSDSGRRGTDEAPDH